MFTRGGGERPPRTDESVALRGVCTGTWARAQLARILARHQDRWLTRGCDSAGNLLSKPQRRDCCLHAGRVIPNALRSRFGMKTNSVRVWAGLPAGQDKAGKNVCLELSQGDGAPSKNPCTAEPRSTVHGRNQPPTQHRADRSRAKPREPLAAHQVPSRGPSAPLKDGGVPDEGTGGLLRVTLIRCRSCWPCRGRRGPWTGARMPSSGRRGG